MQTTKILTVVLAVASFLVLALPRSAKAAKSCTYKSMTYSDGANCCQEGFIYRCDDGSWKATGVRC